MYACVKSEQVLNIYGGSVSAVVYDPDCTTPMRLVDQSLAQFMTDTIWAISPEQAVQMLTATVGLLVTAWILKQARRVVE